METTIVYIDDDVHALAVLVPLLQSQNARLPMRWILVGCAPRITHRVSKWSTHSTRESWRVRWAEKVFEQVVPLLQASGGPVIAQVARGPLDEVSASLRICYGDVPVLDARKPKPGQQPLASLAGSHRSGSGVLSPCSPAPH